MRHAISLFIISVLLFSCIEEQEVSWHELEEEVITQSLEDIGMRQFYYNAKWMVYYTNFDCDTFRVQYDTPSTDYLQEQYIRDTFDLLNKNISVELHHTRIDNDTIWASFSVLEKRDTTHIEYLPLCEFSSLTMVGVIGSDSVYFRHGGEDGFQYYKMQNLIDLDSNLSLQEIEDNTPKLYLRNSWEYFYQDSTRNPLVFRYLKMYNYVPRKNREREFAKEIMKRNSKDIKPWLIKELERRNYY